MTKQDIFYKENIIPEFIKFKDNLKSVLDDYKLLSEFTDESGNFLSPVTMIRPTETGCPETNLSPKFQVDYPEITPEIVSLLSGFQYNIIQMWKHQN